MSPNKVFAMSPFHTLPEGEGWGEGLLNTQGGELDLPQSLYIRIRPRFAYLLSFKYD